MSDAHYWVAKNNVDVITLQKNRDRDSQLLRLILLKPFAKGGIPFRRRSEISCYLKQGKCSPGDLTPGLEFSRVGTA